MSYYTSKDFTSNILVIKEGDVNEYYKNNYNIKDIMENINKMLFEINDVRKDLRFKMFFEYSDSTVYKKYYLLAERLCSYLNKDNSKDTNEIFRIYRQFCFNFADNKKNIDRSNYEASYYHDCRPAQSIGNTNCNVRIVGGYNNMGDRSPGFLGSMITGPNLVTRS